MMIATVHFNTTQTLKPRQHTMKHDVAFAGEPFQGPICRRAFILNPDGNKIGIHKRNTQTQI